MSFTTSPKVQFFFETQTTLTQRSKLKKFIETLFRKEEKEIEYVNYIFCSDERVLGINNEFLAHDYYTDIITFELSAKKAPVQAEVYISVDRVRDNAKKHNQSFSRELHRVIFHGALHLCGYRDKTAKDQTEMRGMEEHYLKAYLKK
jgi:probable rRNA maturation factor